MRLNHIELRNALDLDGGAWLEKQPLQDRNAQNRQTNFIVRVRLANQKPWLCLPSSQYQVQVKASYECNAVTMLIKNRARVLVCLLLRTRVIESKAGISTAPLILNLDLDSLSPTW